MTKFPYDNFPIRLEYNDRGDQKTCWFECQEHLDKHISRYKLNSKEITVEYKNPSDKPTVTPKKSTKSKSTPKQIFSSLEQFFEPNEKTVASVGPRSRRKSTQKRSSSRSSRSS
jgi:hypothetical protein